jgi:hypothetical protein
MQLRIASRPAAAAARPARRAEVGRPVLQHVISRSVIASFSLINPSSSSLSSPAVAPVATVAPLPPAGVPDALPAAPRASVVPQAVALDEPALAVASLPSNAGGALGGRAAAGGRAAGGAASEVASGAAQLLLAPGRAYAAALESHPLLTKACTRYGMKAWVLAVHGSMQRMSWSGHGWRGSRFRGRTLLPRAYRTATNSACSALLQLRMGSTDCSAGGTDSPSSLGAPFNPSIPQP